eukprot:3018070-Amphidinium_carterae.1
MRGVRCHVMPSLSPILSALPLKRSYGQTPPVHEPTHTLHRAGRPQLTDTLSEETSSVRGR